MTKAVKPIPEGYRTVTPYMIINGAASAIEFYKKAFGAIETFRMAGPDGKIGHAEIRIGDSVIMLADEGHGQRSAQSFGGSPISILLYVENVDELVERAISAGGKLQRPAENQFYGDRLGAVTDPFGLVWSIATHVEDIAPEELKRRAAAVSAAGSGGA